VYSGCVQKDGFSVDAISDIMGIKVAWRVEEGIAVPVRAEGIFGRIGAAVRCGFAPGQKFDAQRDQTFDTSSLNHGSRPRRQPSNDHEITPTPFHSARVFR
jgi:hypothetical protein